MLDSIRKYWPLLIGLIIGVFIVIAFKQCNNNNNKIIKIDTVVEKYIKIDTSYKDTIIYRTKENINIVQSKKPTKTELDNYSKPDTNYQSLVKQYNDLKSQYLTENAFTDTIPLADSGYVAVNDLVAQNKIRLRQSTVFQREKTINIKDSIVVTITKHSKIPPQVYVGGELTGLKDQWMNGVNIITMFKDRQDRVYQVKVGMLDYNNKVTTQFGFGMLWKL